MFYYKIKNKLGCDDNLKSIEKNFLEIIQERYTNLIKKNILSIYPLPKGVDKYARCRVIEKSRVS